MKTILVPRFVQLLAAARVGPAKIRWPRADLTGVQVEVTAVDAGLPREAIFRFGADLEGAGFRWIRWAWETEGRARYVPFVPPPIGERMRVE